MITQKGDPYTKLFSTLSGVTLVCCVLSQLNILCSSVIKPYFTKMTIHRLFAVHMLRPFHAFSNILDLIKAEQSIYVNVQHFIWSKKSVFHFTAFRYSLHKWSETILCLKRQFTVHVSPVSCAMEFTDARKTCYRVVRTSIWSIPYSGELCNKNCIVKTSETLIVCRAFCYTAGSDKSDAIEGVPDQLIKRVTMLFRVHNRHVELLFTYWY